MCNLDWQMSVWQKSDGQKSFDKYEMAKVGLAKTGNHQDVANAKLLKIAILAQNRRFGAKSPLVLAALLLFFCFHLIVEPLRIKAIVIGLALAHGAKFKPQS